MSEPYCSIIMTAYQRGHLLRATLNSIAKQNLHGVEILVIEDGNDDLTNKCVLNYMLGGFPIRYFRRKKRPLAGFSNPAPLINFGIKHAHAPILIIQNAECVHVSNNVILNLTAPHTLEPDLAIFAAVLRLQEETEPTNLTSPYFFCGSVRKEWMMKLRGVDEVYTGWGSDDCDLAVRMGAAGIKFVFRPDIIVHHQYHGLSIREGKDENRKIFDDRSERLRSGELSPVANKNREWGVI